MAEEISKVANFDMDNTLCDYMGSMRYWLKCLSSPEEPVFDLNSKDTPPLYVSQRMSLIKQIPGWWKQLPILTTGMSLLTMAKEIGFRINILTKGPWKSEQAWTEKVQWCRENIDVEHEITITQDKSLVYGKILVDDWPEYIIPWLNSRPRGLVLMPAYEYNEHLKHPNVIRINNRYSHSTIKESLIVAYNRKPGEEVDWSKFGSNK